MATGHSQRPQTQETKMIITLHVADRKFACGHTVREITLGSDSDVDIGRASKDTKKNLVADVDNALFDCAVMSRKHALLSTATEDGETMAFLIDSDSTHGTWVNDHRLTPHQPYRLYAGDVLRFGGRVECGTSVHKGCKMHILFGDQKQPRPSSRRSLFGPTYALTYSREGSEERYSEIMRPNSGWWNDTSLDAVPTAQSKTEVADTYADAEVLEVDTELNVDDAVDEGTQMHGSSAADPIALDGFDPEAVNACDENDEVDDDGISESSDEVSSQSSVDESVDCSEEEAETEDDNNEFDNEVDELHNPHSGAMSLTPLGHLGPLSLKAPRPPVFVRDAGLDATNFSKVARNIEFPNSFSPKAPMTVLPRSAEMDNLVSPFAFDDFPDYDDACRSHGSFHENGGETTTNGGNTIDQCNKKRKAHVLHEDAVETLVRETGNAFQPQAIANAIATSARPIMSVSEGRPKKKVRTALYTGLQMAGCAVVGSVATVGFLLSPLAASLAQ